VSAAAVPRKAGKCGKCDPASPTGSNLVVLLTAPWRFFTSAHWFHICEYYLPHAADVAPKLVPNATVFIVAPSDK